MSDEEKKQEASITPQPDADTKRETSELSEEELKKVSGGAIYMKYGSIQGDTTSAGFQNWIMLS